MLLIGTMMEVAIEQTHITYLWLFFIEILIGLKHVICYFNFSCRSGTLSH